MNQPPRRDVIVLIDHRHIQFGGKSPSLFVIGAFIKRAGSANYRYLGIFLLYGIEYHGKAFGKDIRDQIFIANADKFQIERSRMPGFGALPAPNRLFGIAIGIFYQIEHILYIGSHLFHRDAALLPHAAQFTFGMVAACTRILTRNPCRQYRNRLGTYIFAKLEIFEIT